MAIEKRDPTVKSSTTTPDAEVPIHQADDYAGNRQYVDMPDEDKPAPETVAQYEVTPTSGTFAEPKKD